MLPITCTRRWLQLWSRAGRADQRAARWLWVYGLFTALVLATSIVRSGLFFTFTVGRRGPCCLHPSPTPPLADRARSAQPHPC